MTEDIKRKIKIAIDGFEDFSSAALSDIEDATEEINRAYNAIEKAREYQQQLVDVLKIVLDDNEKLSKCIDSKDDIVDKAAKLSIEYKKLKDEYITCRAIIDTLFGKEFTDVMNVAIKHFKETLT